MDATQNDRSSTRTPSIRQRMQTASARNSVRNSIESARPRSSREPLKEKTGVFEQCNELESQSTTQDADVKDGKADLTEATTEATNKTNKTNDNQHERLGQKLARVRSSTWWLLGVIILAIPLGIFAGAFSTTNIDGIRVTGLLVWFEIIWTSWWLVYFFVWFVGKAWHMLCQGGLEKWEDIFLDTKWSQRCFILSLVAYGSSWAICRFSLSSNKCPSDTYWLHVLQKVLLASIPALGIFLVKDVLLQIIITRQAMRMVQGRQEIVLRQFVAFGLMFSDEAEKQTFFFKVKTWCNSVLLGLQGKKGSMFLRMKSPAANDYISLLQRYMNGEGKDEDFDRDGKAFVDVIRDECRTNYAALFTDEDDGTVMENFEEDFFQYIIDQPHKESAMLNGKPLTAKEMLRMMDKDGNGHVTIDEWVEANTENIMAYRDITRSIRGIRSAATVVNVVISCLLLCVVAIIYAAFFVSNLSNYLTPIWTTVTGLSFALSGTVTEFITACSFVFSKQPYDIGDRVAIDDKDLIVDEICLLYTVFHRRSDGAIEQIAHQKISDSWITNLSRSKGLSVKETALLPSDIKTVFQSDLDAHQEELRKFIKDDPVRARYLKADDFQVSLGSGKDGAKHLVVDLKLQDLVVRREDILAGVRNAVRDKMEELLRTGTPVIRPTSAGASDNALAPEKAVASETNETK